MGTIDLNNKPIAITGASSGIGAATALACAKAGMPVAIAARRIEKLEEVAARIRAIGGRVMVSAVDVTNKADCQRFIDETIGTFGSIYGVFANAGYGLEAPIHSMGEKQLRDIFETNFFGTMNTIWPAVPHLVNARAGHIVICSSCLARMPIPYYGAYSATKAAQLHVGRSMRLELAPFGVAVSTLLPIGTKTEFFDQVKHKTGHAELIEHTPDFFMQKPSFVGSRVVNCLRHPRPEIWPGVSGRFVRFGMSVTSLLPRIGDLVVGGMVRRRLSLAERRAASDKPAVARPIDARSS